MASSFDTETDAVEFDNLAKLAENIVYLLPGCSDMMVRKTLQEVYRDFCRRACCLRARRRFAADGHVITAAPAYGGVVDCVADVRMNGRAMRRGMDYDVTDDTPPRVVVKRHIHDWRAHGDACFVEVETIEIPSLTSEMVPHGFLERHGDALVAGALYRLQSMTGRAWTDASQASSNLLRYENGVCEARMRHHFGGESSNGSMDYLPDSSSLI